jgi:hypothetical protein
VVSGIALFENLLFSLAILLSRSGSNFINWFVPICSIVSLAYSVRIYVIIKLGEAFSKPENYTS